MHIQTPVKLKENKIYELIFSLKGKGEGTVNIQYRGSAIPTKKIKTEPLGLIKVIEPKEEWATYKCTFKAQEKADRKVETKIYFMFGKYNGSVNLKNVSLQDSTSKDEIKDHGNLEELN